MFYLFFFHIMFIYLTTQNNESWTKISPRPVVCPSLPQSSIYITSSVSSFPVYRRLTASYNRIYDIYGNEFIHSENRGCILIRSENSLMYTKWTMCGDGKKFVRGIFSQMCPEQLAYATVKSRVALKLSIFSIIYFAATRARTYYHSTNFFFYI